ncbi:MAG: C4-type zinc ribbon domain-containing protein [Phycisphaerae bacterium]|nr:C4-type zinc ribbon domain-containing protein [Phycisphaerae bacterium]
MGAARDALRQLQEIEHQIVDIKRQLRRKEGVVSAQEKKLAELRKSVEAEKAGIQRAQMDFNSLDVDVKARTAGIQKDREQLNAVRTNKEYAAVLKQLNNDKADLSRLETEALARLQTVEAQQAALQQRLQQLQSEESRREELVDQAAQARKSFDTRLGELQAQRAKVAASLPPETVRTFDRLSEHFDGEVLATVERTHPRRDEFVCGGCFLTVTAEVANALTTRDDLHLCKNCGRILTVK